MAWNHDDVGPNRSRDELLGDVVRRGERIRRRRQMIGGLGGSLALLLVVAGVVSAVGTGGQPTTELAAGGRAPTTTGALPATGGTVFAVDAPSTTNLDTATSLVPATTVPDPDAPDPDAPATTTTTEPPAVAEPNPPGPGQPSCGAGVLQARITMAPTFAAGQPVTGQAVLTNTSGAPCYYSSYTVSDEITDLAGNSMIPGSLLIADNFVDTPFAPGQTLTGPIQWTDAPSGSYRVTRRWSFDGPPVEATATFTVV